MGLNEMHTCPNCNFDIDDSSIEVCPQCNFDFNTTLSCPYRISNKCIHINKVCEVYGLNYEACNIYLKQSGIKMS